MKSCFSAFLFAVFFAWQTAFPAVALDAGNEWQPLIMARFGNIEIIDAEDGPLANFLKNIRNDGRFPPPMKTLIGPAIHNPTFYGLVFEAWMEAVVLAPAKPGPVRTLWVFPVDSRDEYMTQLSNQSLAGYEGMDGVTVLREMEQDGNFHTWYLEWLPGNIAVFGTDGDAVAACRRIYAENSAARGLLAGQDGEYMQPDVIVSVDPGAITAWQNSEPGRYWWRSTLEMLMQDLIQYWQPNPARVRLLHEVAEQFILWPRLFDRIALSLWLEEEGIEWRVGVNGGGGPGALSQFSVFRSLPERAALAFAVPLSEQSVDAFGDKIGKLLVEGAGGVMTAEARQAGRDLLDLFKQSQPVQMAAAWVPPPPGKPELGGSRLLVGDWLHPELFDATWAGLREMVRPGTVVSQALSQIGWAVDIITDPVVENAWELFIYPADSTDRKKPYYQSVLAIRKNGGRIAMTIGESREDATAKSDIIAYRAELARETVFSTGDGGPPLRQAFVRLPTRGASIIGILDPIRFVQLALIEMADWRPRSPDQHEPLPTQLAREMLGYGSMGAWTMVGEEEPLGWRFSGSISWQSLARLAGALGITESIGME